MKYYADIKDYLILPPTKDVLYNRYLTKKMLKVIYHGY